MTHTAGKEATHEHAREEQAMPHGQAAQHGHTGEGAASVLAHLNRLGEKHRREDGDKGESPGDEHP
jgi:hypothetical protein